MSKLFACIIADSFEADELISVAKQFAYRIEMLADGIVFDVSGLEKLIGNAKQITEAIKAELREREILGTVAVHPHLNSALLLARENSRTGNDSNKKNNIAKLPLKALEIDKDTLKVFASLGVYEIEDLQQIPENQLVARYGQDFRAIIDAAREADNRFLLPNLIEKTLVWEYEFDDPVTNYEELVFLFNRGLETLFQSAVRYGLSTEQIDICFGLEGDQQKIYEVKTSFPSLERSFWLKLINLRISNESPEAEIVSFSMTLHFTTPRTVQHSLYAASKPTPERLLLTVNKLKKLVGNENVGVPKLVNQRLAKPFTLAPDELPSGKESKQIKTENPVIAFSYFNPPIPVQVVIREKRLIFLKTENFSGLVKNYSGVWKANSFWWGETWKTNEWDVEIDTGGVYRLCKRGREWFVTGIYD